METVTAPVLKVSTRREGERRPSRRLAWIAVAAPALGLTAWAAMAPIHVASREALFEIPRGTWARRMSGDRVEILPDHIRLTIGVRDVLLLRNLDDVPQTFGPTLLMPGQSLRLPFAQASSYQFACTAHASGQMTIDVEPFPQWPWTRLAWRARELFAPAPPPAHPDEAASR
ncbi:MAG TPA: hypothetical protein VGK20_02380 [Candidatus Binatia bacterium]